MTSSKPKNRRHDLSVDFVLDGTPDKRKVEQMPPFKIVVQPPEPTHKDDPSPFPIVAEATPIDGSKEIYFAELWSMAGSKMARQPSHLLNGKLYFVFMVERETQQFLVRLSRESDEKSKDVRTRKLQLDGGNPQENDRSKSAFSSSL